MTCLPIVDEYAAGRNSLTIDSNSCTAESRRERSSFLARSARSDLVAFDVSCLLVAFSSLLGRLGNVVASGILILLVSYTVFLGAQLPVTSPRTKLFSLQITSYAQLTVRLQAERWHTAGLRKTVGVQVLEAFARVQSLVFTSPLYALRSVCSFVLASQLVVRWTL